MPPCRRAIRSGPTQRWAALAQTVWDGAPQGKGVALLCATGLQALAGVPVNARRCCRDHHWLARYLAPDAHLLSSQVRLHSRYLAESANPDWVSVPLEGWAHGRAIAELAQTHLVTQVRNRKAIERAGWAEGAHFTAIDSEPVANPIDRLASLLRGEPGRGWTTKMAMSSFAYYYFEHLVW